MGNDNHSNQPIAPENITPENIILEDIAPKNISPVSIPIEKPDGMSPEAKATYDEYVSQGEDKPSVSSSSRSTPPSLQSRINKIENKLTAKMKKIIKRRRKNISAKKSRKKNRK